MQRILAIITLLAASWSANASAQEQDGASQPRRTRIGLGPQLVPSFPGSEDFSLRPLVDVTRWREGDTYAFEAPDESFGFPLLRSGGFAIGPALGFEGSRDPEDVGVDLPEVDLTVEVGAFVQYAFSDAFRVRAEARKGLNGHEGWIGTIGADYVARDRNDWLFSIGPRVTLADERYHHAYFGVAPADAVPSGLPAYDIGGGVQAVGATAGFVRQFNRRWGIYTYAKYDRLVGDPADSPIVRSLGSRDQLSGGVALTYTFGRDLN